MALRPNALALGEREDVALLAWAMLTWGASQLAIWEYAALVALSTDADFTIGFVL